MAEKEKRLRDILISMTSPSTSRAEAYSYTPSLSRSSVWMVCIQDLETNLDNSAISRPKIYYLSITNP